MIFRTVYLTPESHDFVRAKIESGRYESTTALLQAAFHALNREELKLDTKRSAGCIAEGDPFRKLWDAAAQSSLIQR